jgi:hypothetical protein
MGITAEVRASAAASVPPFDPFQLHHGTSTTPHVHEDKPTASGCFYPHWGIFDCPRKKVKE